LRAIRILRFGHLEQFGTVPLEALFLQGPLSHLLLRMLLGLELQHLVAAPSFGLLPLRVLQKFLKLRLYTCLYLLHISLFLSLPLLQLFAPQRDLLKPIRGIATAAFFTQGSSLATVLDGGRGQTAPCIA